MHEVAHDFETICTNTDVVPRIDRKTGRCNVGSLPEGVSPSEIQRPADKARGLVLTPSGNPRLQWLGLLDSLG